MAKLIGFEKIMISEGIKMFANAFKEEIKTTTEQGKIHMFTEEYIDMMVSEIKSKLKLNK